MKGTPLSAPVTKEQFAPARQPSSAAVVMIHGVEDELRGR